MVLAAPRTFPNSQNGQTHDNGPADRKTLARFEKGFAVQQNTAGSKCFCQDLSFVELVKI